MKLEILARPLMVLTANDAKVNVLDLSLLLYLSCICLVFVVVFVFVFILLFVVVFVFVFVFVLFVFLCIYICLYAICLIAYCKFCPIRKLLEDYIPGLPFFKL